MKSLHPILLELISVLVKNDIEVTFKNDSKTDWIVLDLNTQTKSGVYLLPTELGFTILTRYDSVVEEVDLTDENVDDVIRNLCYSNLCYTVKSNQCGSYYCNQFWLNLMVNKGYKLMTVIIKDNRATLEFGNISNALLHFYFNKGKLESYSFINSDFDIDVDVILTDTYLLKSTLTLANHAIKGEKNTLFSDNDIEEANTIVYVCIPKDAINGDPIYVHQCTNNLEDDAGGLAYALELLEFNKISEILKITFENNLI